MRMRNGYFQLDMRPGGVYLIIYPSVNGGSIITIDEIISYLQKKNFNSSSKVDLRDAIQHAEANSSTEELLIGSAVDYEVNETMDYGISVDKMNFIARFYPPSCGGNTMDMEEIVNSIIAAGVKVGIDQHEIKRFIIDRQYCKDYVMARGIPPLNGHDAKIEYFFNTDLSLKPTQNQDGTVDYRNLNNIGHIKSGDLLARLTKEDPGTCGNDVFGNALKPKNVKKLTLKAGNNSKLSEDQTELYSQVTGHASLVNGEIFVSDIFEVSADVDNSMGDIKYNGNVYVKGNVRSGFSIDTDGDIIVDGVVEGANLNAGGQIILKRGIQGMGKGVLKASGNIIAKFIESAEVVSGGYIETESILHSKVSAKTEISVNGRKGFVTGGIVQAGNLITAKTIGSQMGSNTVIQVGISPEKRERYERLKKEIRKVQSEIDKAYPILTNFWKKIGGGEIITPQKHQYIKQLAKATKEMEKNLKEYKINYEMLEGEISLNNGARVKVTGTIYAGVEIFISDMKLTTKDERKYCQYFLEDGEIKVSNL